MMNIASSGQDTPELLLSRLPKDIIDSFSAEQKAALWAAANAPTWRRHPVNLRFALGIFGRRYFVTLVAGPERRSPDRQRRERMLNPIKTASNILFLVGSLASFYLAAVLAIFLFSLLIES